MIYLWIKTSLFSISYLNGDISILLDQSLIFDYRIFLETLEKYSAFYSYNFSGYKFYTWDSFPSPNSIFLSTKPNLIPFFEGYKDIVESIGSGTHLHLNYIYVYIYTHINVKLFLASFVFLVKYFSNFFLSFIKSISKCYCSISFYIKGFFSKLLSKTKMIYFIKKKNDTLKTLDFLSKKPITDKEYLKDLNDKQRKLLSLTLPNEYRNYRNCTVYLASRAITSNDPNVRAVIESRRLLVRSMSRYSLSIVRTANSLISFIQNNNLIVINNNDTFIPITPSHLSNDERNNILHRFNYLRVELMNLWESINNSINLYNLYETQLLNAGSIRLFRSISTYQTASEAFVNLRSHFLQGTPQMISALQNRDAIIQSMRESILNLNNAVNSALTYMDSNDITLHQDSRGSLQLEHSLSDLEGEQASNYLQDLDIAINTTGQTIFELSVEGFRLETELTMLGPEIGSRVLNYLTEASDIRNRYNDRINRE